MDSKIILQLRLNQMKNKSTKTPKISNDFKSQKPRPFAQFLKQESKSSRKQMINFQENRGEQIVQNFNNLSMKHRYGVQYQKNSPIAKVEYQQSEYQDRNISLPSLNSNDFQGQISDVELDNLFTSKSKHCEANIDENSTDSATFGNFISKPEKKKTIFNPEYFIQQKQKSYQTIPKFFRIAQSHTNSITYQYQHSRKKEQEDSSPKPLFHRPISLLPGEAAPPDIYLKPPKHTPSFKLKPMIQYD